MSPNRPVTVRVARWSATHPWRAIALWLVFVVACIGIGSAVKLHKANDLDTTLGQSGTVAHWLHDAGLEPPDTENVLITGRDGRLPAAAARAAAHEVTTRMAALSKQVAAVAAPSRSQNGTALNVVVTLCHDADVKPLLAATRAVQARYPGLRVEEVGSQSLNDAVNDQVNNDLSAAATFSLPVTLVIMLIAFGAVLAAGVPILLALTAVGSAIGLSSLASHVIPDSGRPRR